MLEAVSISLVLFPLLWLPRQFITTIVDVAVPVRNLSNSDTMLLVLDELVKRGPGGGSIVVVLASRKFGYRFF